MRLLQIPIAELNPYEFNPRQNDHAVDAVANSIKEFGWINPIIIDKNNTIVAGHTRLKAAKKLGMDVVPCLIAEDLTPEQIKAYRIVDNKTSEISDWDVELLEKELRELQDLEFDMEEFGFELLEDVDFVEEDELQDIEEIEPKVNPGDIYQLGEHYLVCGDSTKPEPVDLVLNRYMEGNIDLLLTDIPYNVEYTGKTKDALQIENDSLTRAQEIALFSGVLQIVNKYSEPGCPFYIWHGHKQQGMLQDLCRTILGEVRQILIWVKSTMALGRSDCQWKHEQCVYGWKEGAAHYFVDDRTQTTVFEDAPNINRMTKDQLKERIKELQTIIDDRTTVLHVDKPNASIEHPTMKPIKLLAPLIRNSSRKGDVVFDPFGGSGSTLIACEQLGRRCLTIELDPKYCDVIINRWENLTGEKAELIEES